MYYSSYYTKMFRFDDIWLGLIAQKADLDPFHCEEFHFYRQGCGSALISGSAWIRVGNKKATQKNPLKKTQKVS
jgi:hypothetical protein